MYLPNPSQGQDTGAPVHREPANNPCTRPLGNKVGVGHMLQVSKQAQELSKSPVMLLVCCHWLWALQLPL